MSARVTTSRAPGRSRLPQRHRVVRSAGLTVRFERRAACVNLALACGIVAVAVIGLLLGDYGISASQVLAALVGRAGDPLAEYFVTGVRAPRVVTGLLVGAALGTSGAIFQTISGNPLGSPDIIGFSTGAATGALVQIVLFGAGTAQIALAAVVGGLATAGLVYGLAWRGGVAGFRLVLVGIGVGAALAAVNSLLVVKASLVSAQTAAQWLAGSLNASLWPGVVMLGASLAVLLPLAWSQFRPLTMIPLGDAVAVGMGVRVERSRLLLVVVGVALVAVATAATGPVAFVALAAPHLVRRLAATAGTGLVGAALMGAFLVLGGDVIAQRLFAPTELAVGVVTGALGGVYLIILLASQWRRQRS